MSLRFKKVICAGQVEKKKGLIKKSAPQPFAFHPSLSEYTHREKKIYQHDSRYAYPPFTACLKGQLRLFSRDKISEITLGISWKQILFVWENEVN